MLSQTAATDRLPAPDLEALLANLAVAPEQALAFSETRDSGLLTDPLEVRGLLRRDREGRLIRETHAPRQETQILAADYVEIRRETRFRQRFGLHRAPELGALREALTAVLEGDVEALTEHFHSVLDQDEDDRWTLSLRPRDPALAERVEELNLGGSGSEMQTLRMTLADGEVVMTRFEPVP